MPKTASKKLRDNLVNDVAKTNGATIFRQLGVLTLRNKSYESGIPLLRHITMPEMPWWEIAVLIFPQG